MTCPECEMNNRLPHLRGNHPNQVVEIYNDEELVLFHRVDISASLGDDETNPPVQGAYKNVLLVYEANNHVYLYNSDGIYTALQGAGGVNNFDDLSGRPTYAGQAMTSSTNIPDVSAVAADVLNVTNNLASETTARTTGDATLQSALDTETSARTAADTALTTALDDEVTDRSTADTILQDSIDDLGDELSTDIQNNTTAISTINTAINRNVMTGLAVSNNSSTTNVSLDGSLVNLRSGATTSSTVALPVASASAAGVMNSATFNAIQSNSADIDAILNGSVAISNLSSSPSQNDLTTAWETATGYSELINRAAILDVTNDKTWTYYDNTTTWYPSDNTTTVTISQWTNSSAGIVKGSTAEGQIFAENDGTGSVNGYDTLKANLTTATANIASITTTLAGKQDTISDLATIRSGAALGATALQSYTETDPTVPSWAKASTKPTYAYSEITGKPTLATVATSGSYTDLSNKPTIPTVNNATLTIQKNGTSVGTFTANSSTNTTANITVPTKTSDLTNDSGFITSAPTITMTTTDPGEGAALAANNFIAVYEA